MSKIFITAGGDPSVGLDPTHVVIDWPGLENLDLDTFDPEVALTYDTEPYTNRRELREDLLGLFSRWMDTGIRVEFEDELQAPDAFEDTDEDAITGERVWAFYPDDMIGVRDYEEGLGEPL